MSSKGTWYHITIYRFSFWRVLQNAEIQQKYDKLPYVVTSDAYNWKNIPSLQFTWNVSLTKYVYASLCAFVETISINAPHFWYKAPGDTNATLEAFRTYMCTISGLFTRSLREEAFCFTEISSLLHWKKPSDPRRKPSDFGRCLLICSKAILNMHSKKMFQCPVLRCALYA